MEECRGYNVHGIKMLTHKENCKHRVNDNKYLLIHVMGDLASHACS